MIKEKITMRKVLEEGYGFLFESELMDEIVVNGVLRKYPKGEVIIDYHETINRRGYKNIEAR